MQPKEEGGGHPKNELLSPRELREQRRLSSAWVKDFAWISFFPPKPWLGRGVEVLVIHFSGEMPPKNDRES